MSKPIRSLFPAMLIAALSLPALVAAQSDPGSLDDLLGADFEPLQNRTVQPQPDLNAPLIMGPQVQRPQQSIPQLESSQLESVLEIPSVTIDEPVPGELVLPDLTMPTPENTAMDSRESRRSLKPQFEVRPPDRIELLPLGDRDAAESRLQRPLQSMSIPQPRLQSPQALNYGSRAFSSRSRIQFVPVEVEFFSVSRGFGYQPYGGYRSGYSYGYGRPPVGYFPYGGGNGRYCPYGR